MTVEFISRLFQQICVASII